MAGHSYSPVVYQYVVICEIAIVAVGVEVEGVGGTTWGVRIDIHIVALDGERTKTEGQRLIEGRCVCGYKNSSADD